MAKASLKLGETIQGHTYMGGNPNDQSNWVNVDELAASGKSGDEFLGLIKDKHPALIPQLKMLSEGRLAVPQARAATDPYWQSMMKLGALYDPSLDQVDYSKRQATAKDFAAGASSQNIRNLNQAIGHLKGLVNTFGSVAGHQGLLGLGHVINQGENWFEKMNGDPGITDYNAHRTALASELAAVFKGKGASSETEVSKFYDMLDPNMSTAQKTSVARAVVNMLNSRIDELGQQYNQGMGTTKEGIELLNPIAKKNFESMRTLGLDQKDTDALNADNPVVVDKPRGRRVGRFIIEGG
jgi:hypothetical protein